MWVGTPPSFVRGGQYGEHRGILPGGLPISDYEIIHNNMCYGSIRGAASLGYQATTRGGRAMDNILSSQASFKGFTDDFGDSLIDAADDVGDPYVMLGLFVAGAISKGVSAATTVEADIRAWRTLPNEFQVVPMNLAPGNYEVRLCAYKYVSPLATEPASFTIKDGQPVNVVHVFAYEFGKESIATMLGMPDSERYPVTLSKAGYLTVDKNGNGKLCGTEQNEAMAFILNKFDLNKNGSIDNNEESSLLHSMECRTCFYSDMQQAFQMPPYSLLNPLQSPQDIPPLKSVEPYQSNGMSLSRIALRREQSVIIYGVRLRVIRMAGG